MTTVFMRISRGRVKTGMWLEYERRYLQIVNSGLGRPGPKARWLLRDLDDLDTGYTVSLWESEDAMRRYSSDPAIRAQIETTFKDLFTGEFETHQCEVRLGPS